MSTLPARTAAPRRTTLAAALMLGLAPFTASAATINVTSPDDTDPTSATTCTLRQAILSMNAASPVGACTNSGADTFGTNDTVTFAASALAGTVPGTITLADSADASGTVGGALVVDASVGALVIDGSAWRGNGGAQFPGGVTIARSAAAIHAFGLLSAGHAPGTSDTSALTLDGLTFTGGSSQSASIFGADISCGGAIATTYVDLTLVDSAVTGNSAGSVFSGGTGGFGGGIFSAFGTLTLVRTSVSNNKALIPADSQSGSSGGGGLMSAYGPIVVIDSVLSGNTAFMGGAAAAPAGPVTLIRSTVRDNMAAMIGGGLFLGDDSTLIDSTISSNSAAGGGGIGALSGTLTLNATNSTFAGNQATQMGGAIYLPSGTTLAMIHATISGNAASPINGTGGAIAGQGNATALNSIVAGNTQASGDDVALTASGTWTPTDSITSVVGLNLGSLAHNGGPTQTMLPGAGSTAINAVACLASVTADQRGMLRPDPASAGLATPCDIGAVEAGSIVDRIFANGFETGSTP